MSSNTTSFQLDRSIFNPSLYTSIYDLWFSKLPAGNKRGTQETAKQWWGLGRSADEGTAFDNLCRERYGPALESISPSKLILPPWTSYSEDLAQAQEIAAPFLQEIESAKQDAGEKKAADTLLAITLLLDQIPRNIYRTAATLPLIYKHYDRLALSLLHASPSTLTSHPSFRGAPAYKQWLSLPYMHSEDLASQKEGYEYMQQCQNEAREDVDQETVENTERAISFSKSHLDIVERFGRFPHRNECLQRKNTEEEEEWLKTGETFGVKQGQT